MLYANLIHTENHVDYYPLVYIENNNTIIYTILLFDNISVSLDWQNIYHCPRFSYLYSDFKFADANGNGLAALL